MNLPRKRVIIAWHRWMGLLSALFLVVLSITGLALNHTERLGLNQIQVRNSWILSKYGMEGGNAISGFRIHEGSTLAHLGGQLFYDGSPLANSEEPIGIFEGDPITVIASGTELIYLSTEGELIEAINSSQLPFSIITAVGQTDSGQAVLVTVEGNWSPDANWLEFTAHEGAYSVEPLSKIELSPGETDAILDSFQGGGISLYRVLLDLHAGRLFGWGGRTLMDLTAVAIILLVTSGIGGWLRKSRKQTKPRGA